MSQSSIEWTDETWNPVRGCSRISEGCRNCYAERQAGRFTSERFKGFVTSTPSGPRWTGKLELIQHKLVEPLRWRRSRKVFVNSMSDLFHESLSFEDIDLVFAAMMLSPRQTFQVLTKRAERMHEYFSLNLAERLGGWDRHDRVRLRAQELGCQHKAAHFAAGVDVNVWPLPNLWLGVSVEDQAAAEARIPALLLTPAAVRWISAEPLLGPIDLSPVETEYAFGEVQRVWKHGALGEAQLNVCGEKTTLPGLDWVVVGGESGPGARPCKLRWIRNVVGQCLDNGVAVFVKQLGAHPVEDFETEPYAPNSETRLELASKKGGDPEEWPADLRVRQFPAGRVP